MFDLPNGQNAGDRQAVFRRQPVLRDRRFAAGGVSQEVPAIGDYTVCFERQHLLGRIPMASGGYPVRVEDAQRVRLDDEDGLAHVLHQGFENLVIAD